jgi:hypothetical protein
MLLSLDPKYCTDTEKNDSTVKMKKLTAGSKAKTVQLADFKCLVCSLDVQIEKRPPKYTVCGQGSGEPGEPGEQPPVRLLSSGICPYRPGRQIGASPRHGQHPSRRAEGTGQKGRMMALGMQAHVGTRLSVASAAHRLTGSEGGLQSPWQKVNLWGASKTQGSPSEATSLRLTGEKGSLYQPVSCCPFPPWQLCPSCSCDLSGPVTGQSPLVSLPAVLLHR